MDDLDVADDTDEFWENTSSHWCGMPCLYTITLALAIGIFVDIAFVHFLARRKHPLTANESFMFAVVLNELIHSACLMFDDHIGSLIHSLLGNFRDPIWFCRVRFALYKASEVASLVLPALLALHEVAYRRSGMLTSTASSASSDSNLSSQPVASFLLRHRISLIVDLLIVCLLLSSPIFFVVGQRRAFESCTFLFYRAEDKTISIIGTVCAKVRFLLVVTSLLTLWAVTIYLCIRAATLRSSTSPSMASRFASVWAEQKLLICLSLKSLLVVTPYLVIIELHVLFIEVPLWLGDIGDLAFRFNFSLSAPLFVLLHPELRFWRHWVCCQCIPVGTCLRSMAVASRRKSFHQQRQQQEQQQQTTTTTTGTIATTAATTAATATTIRIAAEDAHTDI